MEITPKPEWSELVTFVPNKNVPLYNWFHYKEGFSRQIVFELLDEFNIKKGIVLDPFCGVGTTLLACKERGLDSIGFDVSPIALLASSVKTAYYDKDALKDAAKKLLKKKFSKTTADVPKIMKIGFSRHVLEDVLFFRDEILRIDDEKIRDFFLLALTRAAINVSWTWKDGSVIKIRKRDVAPLRLMLRRSVYRMIKDVDKLELPVCETRVECADARRMPLTDECVDAIITSPPYLNNIDYTKVYAIENFIAGSQQETQLRSCIDDEKYFSDMTLVIKEMFRVCKNGAKCAIIIGNAPMHEVDLMLTEISSEEGFAVEKIYNAKQRYELENRTIKKGLLRESVLMLKKAE